MTREEIIANLNMISVAFVEPVTKEQRKLIDDTFSMAIQAMLENEELSKDLDEALKEIDGYERGLSQKCVGSTQKSVGNALEMRCDDAIDRAEAMTEIMMFAGNAKLNEEDIYIKVSDAVQLLRELPSVRPQEPKTGQYEKHIDHTDCIWYGNDSGCPVTCSQYRDGWNDAMDYIFKNGKGYQPYRHEL